MTHSDTLLVEDKDGVRLLTINRQDALNALNFKLYDALADALTEAELRREIKVVVITGTGRSYCAGTDLGELGNSPKFDDGKRHGFDPFMQVLEAFPKPLIAAVNGMAIGIGVTMLPHCDMVIASDEARFRAPFVTLGVTAEAGSTFLLPQQIGWAETAHFIFTSSWMDVDKALECGLVWRKVSASDLMEEALGIASDIAKMPVTSLIATKRLMLDARLAQVREARAREIPTFGNLVGAPANKEALAAFKEKREPDFRGL